MLVLISALSCHGGKMWMRRAMPWRYGFSAPRGRLGKHSAWSSNIIRLQCPCGHGMGTRQLHWASLVCKPPPAPCTWRKLSGTAAARPALEHSESLGAAVMVTLGLAESLLWKSWNQGEVTQRAEHAWQCSLALLPELGAGVQPSTWSDAWECSTGRHQIPAKPHTNWKCQDPGLLLMPTQTFFPKCR